VSADPITYCLERISDFRDFERLCSALLAGIGYPTIEPLGGTGDEGRDAIIRSDERGRKICFAYTVRSDWRTKLAADSKRVDEKGHAPDVFVFVCTEALSASEKDFAHKSITEKYGWVLDLFDLERLRVQLVGAQRHLIAQHTSIFTPPFFPQRGGQSIFESRDTILIDHVDADSAVATWLARRLSLAGFRSWCRGTAPLAGEDADATVRTLLKLRANQYLPMLSPESLSDDLFRERCAIATAIGENFVLPCGSAALSDVQQPASFGKLTPADFLNSWNGGLNQVLARFRALGIEPSFDPERGRQIALRDFLPTRVTVASPEPVFANVFPIQLPKTMLVFELRRSLTQEEILAIRKQWAFAELSAEHVASFAPPPGELLLEQTTEFSWVDIPNRDGKKTSDLARELARRSLDVACAMKELAFCHHRRSYYFPRRNSGEWNQPIRHVDGRMTTVQLTGERTKGWGDRASPFLYQLGPKFRPMCDFDGSWSIAISPYIRVTTPQGVLFDGKEVARRRKIVSRSWWNKEWLARLLGIVQAIENSEGAVTVGEGKRAVVMQTAPLSWECPVGLDVAALSGLSDMGHEIAQYRTRDDDGDTEGDASSPLAESTAHD